MHFVKVGAMGHAGSNSSGKGMTPGLMLRSLVDWQEGMYSLLPAWARFLQL